MPARRLHAIGVLGESLPCVDRLRTDAVGLRRPSGSAHSFLRRRLRHRRRHHSLRRLRHRRPLIVRSTARTTSPRVGAATSSPLIAASRRWESAPEARIRWERRIRASARRTSSTRNAARLAKRATIPSPSGSARIRRHPHCRIRRRRRCLRRRRLVHHPRRSHDPRQCHRCLPCCHPRRRHPFPRLHRRCRLRLSRRRCLHRLSRHQRLRRRRHRWAPLGLRFHCSCSLWCRLEWPGLGLVVDAAAGRRGPCATHLAQGS